MKNVTPFILFFLVSVTSCTKIFFLQNETEKQQLIKLKCTNCAESDRATGSLQQYEKRDKISDLKFECKDSSCEFNFFLKPQASLPLTTILIQGSDKEEKYLMLSKADSSVFDFSYDTVLYKVGQKEEINKFKLTSKIFAFIGKATYVYRLKE